MSSRSKSVKGTATEMDVLSSTSLLPWQFKLWEDSITIEAKSLRLWDFFTGERPSKFGRERPLFGWELMSEVWVRDPSVDIQSLRSVLAAEIQEVGTTETHPYSYTEGLAEASPQSKTSAAAALPVKSDRVRAGQVKREIRDSPEVADEELADVLRTTESETFYYARYDAFRRAQGSFDADERIHDERRDKGTALLMISLSSSVKKAFKSVIATGDQPHLEGSAHALWAEEQGGRTARARDPLDWHQDREGRVHG
jgi:hypothetical protein